MYCLHSKLTLWKRRQKRNIHIEIDFKRRKTCIPRLTMLTDTGNMKTVTRKRVTTYWYCIAYNKLVEKYLFWQWDMLKLRWNQNMSYTPQLYEIINIQIHLSKLLSSDWYRIYRLNIQLCRYQITYLTI